MTSVKINQLSDLNHDGKVNGVDRYISNGGEDVNNDGKIDWEDFFRHRGVEKDMDGNGKWQWQDYLIDRVTKAKDNAVSKGNTEKAAELEGWLADGKITGNEWADFRGIKDYTGDGRRNWIDNWAKTQIRKNDDITEDNAPVALDYNGDGKINRQDVLISRGVKDYDGNGIVNEEDNVYHKTYGGAEIKEINDDLNKVDMGKLKETLDNELATPAKSDKEARKEYKRLNLAVGQLDWIQKENNINPYDYTRYFANSDQADLKLGENGPTVAGDLFTSNQYKLLDKLNVFSKVGNNNGFGFIFNLFAMLNMYKVNMTGNSNY